jgi:hypothetical protein
MPPLYPQDFTKASIKELAATDFAQSCPDSLKRLMFKVGLVQHERPARVYATAQPKGAAAGGGGGGGGAPSAAQLLQLLQSQQQQQRVLLAQQRALLAQEREREREQRRE